MNKGHYLFTSESVSSGHPDKIADAISDAILDNILGRDENARVACETMVTTGQVIVAGEITTTAYVDIPTIVRDTIKDIGYDKAEYMFDGNSCGILTAIHSQSPDIAMGVDNEEQGAGDQGMMFGYATNETPNYMPMTYDIATDLIRMLEDIRKKYPNTMPYLRPDAKSQVTIEYDENDKPIRLDTIVISTQHDENVSTKQIKDDIIRWVITPVISHYNIDKKDCKILINPTGRFVIGGPAGDTGLTGRKIIVDTYGGWGAHGGGAFSGKDASKVDRSGAYAARHIAKNLVAANVCDRCLVQIAYAIGVADPVSVCVNTYGTNKTNRTDEDLSKIVKGIFLLTPRGIIDRFNLTLPKFYETSSHGHFGREPQNVIKKFNGMSYPVKLFSWEELDYVGVIKKAVGV